MTNPEGSRFPWARIESMPNDRPDLRDPDPGEPTVKVDRSNLIGWGLFALVALGILLARILGGGGC